MEIKELLWLLAWVFLEINGITTIDKHKVLYDAVMKMASGQFDKVAMADILRKLTDKHKK